MSVAIIDYGAGNTQSVIFALQRLGLSPMVTGDAEEIRAAERVIFPGVGHAGQAMATLKEKGLDQVITSLTQPVFGVCIGMQLLCKSSEEANTPGLGLFEVDVVRFQGKLKVPHMGWNNLEHSGIGLFAEVDQAAHGYYVHSYYAPVMENTIATTEYIVPFSAALSKDNFYGCQFHPEKSGEVGSRILKNFLNLKI